MKPEFKPLRASYSGYTLKEVVWRLREVEEVPEGFQREPINHPEDAVRGYEWLFKDWAVERMVVFLLDAKNKVTAIVPVSTGSLNASLVHPREVFFAAIGGLAASVIVGHNHPSGDPEPSIEDVNVTKQIVASGKILGIPVHDHLIFGGHGRYVSLAERGLM